MRGEQPSQPGSVEPGKYVKLTELSFTMKKGIATGAALMGMSAANAAEADTASPAMRAADLR